MHRKYCRYSSKVANSPEIKVAIATFISFATIEYFLCILNLYVKNILFKNSINDIKHLK